MSGCWQSVWIAGKTTMKPENGRLLLTGLTGKCLKSEDEDGKLDTNSGTSRKILLKSSIKKSKSTSLLYFYLQGSSGKIRLDL